MVAYMTTYDQFHTSLSSFHSASWLSEEEEETTYSIPPAKEKCIQKPFMKYGATFVILVFFLTKEAAYNDNICACIPSFALWISICSTQTCHL